MSGRIVTVFGASGFLGRHIVRALAKAGWRVRAAVRHPNLAEFLRPMGLVGQVQPFKADIARPDEVAAAVRGADAVVNLVGVMHGGLGGKRFFAVHEEGARNVAEAAAAAGVGRLVHVSALGASEDSVSGYARSKAAGETAVRAAFPAATILRPSVVFGQEDQFFNRFANLARYTLILPLIGGGRTKFQPVFVGDVAQAIVNAIDTPATIGKTYELAGPDVFTLAELARLAGRWGGRQRPIWELPYTLGQLQASVLGALPKPLMSADNFDSMSVDNVASGPVAPELGITPTPLAAVAPQYLAQRDRFGEERARAHR